MYVMKSITRVSVKINNFNPPGRIALYYARNTLTCVRFTCIYSRSIGSTSVPQLFYCTTAYKYIVFIASVIFVDFITAIIERIYYQFIAIVQHS